MDERVSSWRMIFALACVLLLLASVPPDLLLAPFGRSPKVYDAARPRPDQKLAPATPKVEPIREDRQEEEIALLPCLRLACDTHVRPREVGNRPFGSKAPNVFRLVSESRTSEVISVASRTARIEPNKSVSVPSSEESIPTVSKVNSSVEPEQVASFDRSKETPIILLSPPPRITKRRSYAELMEQFAQASSETTKDVPEHVIMLPSPPPGEVHHPAWTEPRSLLAALDQLQENEWAAGASERIREMGKAAPDQFADHLATLSRQHEQATTATTAASSMDRAAACNATAALERRLDVWKAMVAAGWPGKSVSPDASPDRRRLAAVAANIDDWLRNVPNHSEWADFLCLATIQQLAADEQTTDEALQNSSIRVLGRLMDISWSTEEESSLTAEPFAPYIAELRACADEPVDFGWLLKTLERFETSHNPQDAYRLARAVRTLKMSSSPSTRVVGETLDRHYRNANLMMRVRTEFLNRFVPQREAEYEWVHDVILGQPIHGNAKTESTVRFRTLPAEDMVLLALEVEGRVSSLTSADAGPAVLFNNSRSNYVTQKQIAINAEGITYQPSTARVYSTTRLRGMRTALDPIPLVGALMQDVVLSQHQQKKPFVRREVQRKVAAKARRRVDEEADPRLDQLSDKYRAEVLGRLAALGVTPELIDADTTEEGFIAAVRLAGNDQLASYGPPPVLDSDAEAAIWIHETALNNLLERARFNGKTFSTAELTKTLSGDSGSDLDESIAEKHGDVRVTFAPNRAVQIACEDGVIELTLAIRELVKPPRKWKNFFVRARLKPILEGKQIKLVRTGVVGLHGRKFRIQSQIALRGIFSKVFDDDRPFEVMPKDISEDERLAELQIAALTVRSGWIVFALDGEPLQVVNRPAVESESRR